MSLILAALASTATPTYATTPTCVVRGPSPGFGAYLSHAGGFTNVRSWEQGHLYHGIEGCGPPVGTLTPDLFFMLHGEGATATESLATAVDVLTWNGTEFHRTTSISDQEIVSNTGLFVLRERSGDRIAAGAGLSPYPSFAEIGIYVQPDWHREALVRMEPFSRPSSESGFLLSGWTLVQPVFAGVRIWERHPGGAWVEDPVGIVDEDLGIYGFGRSVAIWRDTIAVGVPYGPGTEPERGLVLVYERDASGAWSQTASLLGAESGARFGYDVELWGNLLVVGAQGATDEYGAGHVEVFRRSPTGWDLIDVSYSPESPDDGYGFNVELWGTVALVPQLSSLLDPAVFVYQIPAVDQDGDGFDETTDCADLDPEVFPGAPERCGDTLDDDCDESADEGCPDEPPPDTGDSGTPTTGTGDTGGHTDPPDADPPADDSEGCGCGGQTRPGWTALLLLLLIRRRP